MTAGVYTMTTLTLPPAFVGVPYEAAVAFSATAPSEVSAQSITNLPKGLVVDAVSGAHGSVRISGTPTGAANATPQAGVGAYTVVVSTTDGTGTNGGSLTLNLYNSPNDLLVTGGRSSQDGLN